MIVLLILSLAGVQDTQVLPTAQQAAEGWVALFDGQTTFGWRTEGTMRVESGKLLIGGDKETNATPALSLESYEARIVAAGKGGVTLGGEIPRIEIPATTTQLHLAVSGNGSPTLKVGQRKGLESDRLDFTAQRPGGGKVFCLAASSPRQVAISSAWVRPTGLKPIFDGKTLDGWKIFPDRKSSFTVTPDGWLHVKNGPGDLQTVDSWANFVLQLECKVNGDRLNSGVFFRCRPNEYQQGYEAQIHNAFTAVPEKEYTLDDYDPITNQSLAKRKEKYAAVDYGTGAIYRRQPARKSVANDREWFTLTVIAVDRLMNVWVDGVWVTSWLDNRPANENGRNGYRAQAGPISFQGHDPGTDLFFRNIRIAPLP